MLIGIAQAADPVVTNVRAEQRQGTKLVDIWYDVSGSTTPAYVSLQISSNGGTTFAVPATALGGDVGSIATLGRNKRIVWNAGTDWNGQVSNAMRFRVAATDAPPAYPYANSSDFEGNGWAITKNVYRGNYDVGGEIWWDQYLQAPNSAEKTVTIPAWERNSPIRLTYRRAVSNNRLKVYFNGTLLESVANNDNATWPAWVTKTFVVTNLVPASGQATVRFENDDIYQYYNHTKIDDISLSH